MTGTQRRLALLDHLGIGKAHIATQIPADIAGLAMQQAGRLGGIVFRRDKSVVASKKQWSAISIWIRNTCRERQRKTRRFSAIGRRLRKVSGLQREIFSWRMTRS